MSLSRSLDSLLQDVRYALRVCLRRPMFAAAAVFSLALAIGANTLVFSVVNALVLRPLPVERPGELVFVQSSRSGATTHSFPNYRDFRDRSRTMAGLLGYRISPMDLDQGGRATRVWGYLATGNYFDLLGLRPAAGRLFTAQDDRQPGAAPFAVLSYDAWQRRFAGNPAVVGTTIRINRQPYTVLGVAPRGFQGTELFYRPEIWVPMMMQAQIEVGNPWLEKRQTHNTWIIGRMKPGIAPAQAEADLNAIAADLRSAHPFSNRELHVTLAQPGLVGDTLRGPVKAFTLGLLLLAALVLVAGCANLASILLAQGADREREVALRLAIGAGRARLVQQLLTEAVLLALAGGLAGAALAWTISAALSAWRAPLDLPVQFDVQPDVRVLLFGTAVSIVAGMIFGLAPARQASRVDPNTALKGAVGGVGGRGRRWALRDALVAVQVALCFVLVSACLVSVRGLQLALSMPVGFEAGGVAVAGVELGLAGYSEDRGREMQQRLLTAVSALPGVQAAAYSNSLPLSVDQSSTTVSREEAPDPTSESRSATYYQVSPGFFEALRIRRIAGRDFEWRDARDTPQVAIVNEAFARLVLQTTSPVGKRFRYGRSEQIVEVIGLVADGKYTTLTEAARPVVFQPILQRYNATTMIVARTTLPEAVMVGEIRRAIAALDAGLSVHGAGSLTDLLRFAWFPSRVAAIALSAFGLLALTLAATGIHGLGAYAVARRQKEIGLRMALGASRAGVVRLVLGRVAATVGVGAVIGLVLSLAAGSVLASIVYQASPRDPLVLAGVAGILLAIGLASAWAPLRKALRIDPMVALRSE